MAKWGEGDPRWIVEERPDAKNVNNWHWTEKNATQWSQDRLKALLVGLVIEDGPLKVEITEIKKCEGEATANNRKAKLIFFFEWVLELKWEGHIAGLADDFDRKLEGTIEVPNLSDENSADEVDVTPSVSSKNTSSHEDKLLHLLRTKGETQIRACFQTYINDLKTEYSKDLVLPTKQMPQVKVNANAKTVVNKKDFQNTVGPLHEKISLNQDSVLFESSFSCVHSIKIFPTPKQVINSESSNDALDEKDTREINLKETFKVPPDRLFSVLTETEMMQMWSNGPCKSDVKENGEFELYKGMVSGCYTEIDSPTHLRMRWRLRSYPTGHYADVTFRLDDTGDATELHVCAKKVPKSRLEETERGFEQQYFAQIIRTFGFSARLF